MQRLADWEAQNYHEDFVLVPASRTESVFAGLTIAKAKIINSALTGLKVLVAASYGLGRYRFVRITLPGDWQSGSLAGPGDLILAAVRDNGRKGCGTRIVSASLIRVFAVVQHDPDYICSQCGATILHGEKIHDRGGLGNHVYDDGTFEWEQRFECADCW